MCLINQIKGTIHKKAVVDMLQFVALICDTSTTCKELMLNPA